MFFPLVGLVAVALAGRHSGATPRVVRGECGQTDVRTRARFAPSLITGRYIAGDEILFVAVCGTSGDTIAIVPGLWDSIEYTLRVGPDSFAVFDRPRRTIVLVRDSTNRVVSVRTTGFGIAAQLTRAARANPLPIEHLLFDTAGSAAVTALTSGRDATPARASDLTNAVFSTFPSRRRFISNVLRRLVTHWPTDLTLGRQEAEALAITGDTAGARGVINDVRRLSPSDTGVQRILTWLDGGTALPDTGWRIPFDVGALLAYPTADELTATWQAIAARDRSPHDVSVLQRGHIVTQGDSFTVTIISHLSGGQRHIGAIFAPVAPLGSCCATIVDIKGTNPSYHPLELDRGPPALRMLGSAARAYIFVVPAIRGEIIHFGGEEFKAGGDRTDGWDGGAEDVLSLLAAAATVDAKIDPARVCAFGRSRGGGVALLVAERDPRIRCVVAISPPVDWFDAMFAHGWPKSTALRVALRTHAGPFDRAGQFVEWVVAPVARGEHTLAQARQQMIGMSPLYFTARLPPTLAFFGDDDTSVPSTNAVLLDSAFEHPRDGDLRTNSHSVILAPMAGHDTDPAEVVRAVPAFLAHYLGTPVGTRYPGADAR